MSLKWINKKVSLQTYLTLFSLVVGILFIGLFGFIFYRKINNFLLVKRQESIELKVNQVSTDIENRFNHLHQMISSLKTNELIVSHLNNLSNQELTPTTHYNLSKELERYLYSIRLENSMINNILIVTPDTQYSSNHSYLNFDYNGLQLSPQISNQYNFISIGQAQENIFFSDPPFYGDKSNDVPDQLNSGVFFGANIEDTKGEMEASILFLLDLPSFLNQMFYSEQFIIFDQYDQVLFQGTEQELSLTRYLEQINQSDEGIVFTNTNLEIHHKRIPIYNLKLVFVEDMSQYQVQQKYIWRAIIISLIVAMTTIYIIAKRLSTKTLRPLYHFLDDLNRENIIELRHIKARRSSKKFSLRERLFIYFLLTILIPTVLFVILFFGLSSDVVFNDIQANDYLIHEEKGVEINRLMEQSKLTLIKFALDTQLQQHILNDDSEQIMNVVMTDNKYQLKNHETLHLYNHDQQLLYSNHTNPRMTEFSLDSFAELRPNHISYSIQTDRFNHAFLILGLPIFNSLQSDQLIGYATIMIPSDYLSTLYRNNERKDEKTLIVNDNHLVLLSHDIDRVGEYLDISNQEANHPFDWRSDDNYYFSTALQIGDLKLVSQYIYQDIQGEINQLFLSDSYLLFLIVLLILLFSYWIPKLIINPLEYVNHLFATLDINDANQQVLEQITGIDELDRLQDNFSQNFSKMNQLINETLEANKQIIETNYEKREIQMHALQSQVNPHFLYNTLDNLLYIVETEQTDKAVEMITSLSIFFRFITNQEKHLISIADEISFTKSYLAIMESRFDNFYCTWDIDQELYDHKTIKLILQPIVENIIKHSAKQTEKAVEMVISCKEVSEGNKLQFIVTDDGVGIDRERLVRIQDLLNSNNTKKSGIFNVNMRVKTYFGPQYGVRIESEQNKGTKVLIDFPIDQTGIGDISPK